MRAIRRPQLLAGLASDEGVQGGHCRLSEGHFFLSRHFCEAATQGVVFRLVSALPCGEPAGFTVVSIVGEV